jgi:hypothetical protein
MNIQRLVFFGIAIMVPLSAQIFSASFTPSNITDAPYSATQITERTEIRADGTQVTIPAEEETMYRDSAGRTRIDLDSRNCRTATCLIIIVDPLAGFRYQVNSYSKVAERFAIPVSRPPAIEPQAPTPDMTVPGPVGVVSTRPIMDGAVRGIGMAENHFKTTSEFLGTQMIEGVAAEGGRIVTTLEASAAGTDHDVAVTDERWASKDLRVLLLKKLLDPRYGDTISRLTHINSAEPDPALFVPPADYKIEDMPTPNPVKQ